MGTEVEAETKDSRHLDPSGVSGLSSGPSSDSLGKSLHFPASVSQSKDLGQQKKTHKSVCAKTPFWLLTSPFMTPVQACANPQLSPHSELSLEARTRTLISGVKSPAHDRTSKSTSSEALPLHPSMGVSPGPWIINKVCITLPTSL